MPFAVQTNTRPSSAGRAGEVAVVHWAGRGGAPEWVEPPDQDPAAIGMWKDGAHEDTTARGAHAIAPVRPSPRDSGPGR